MKTMIRFTEPEQDIRLKELASGAEEAVIKNIYGYVRQYGAIRSDVYEFLVAEGKELCKADYNYIIELLHGQAECAWFELFLKIGREKPAASLYKREVLEAFRKGLPPAAAEQCYEKAMTPYDMGLAVQEYQRQPIQEEENKETEEKGEVLLLREQLREAKEELEVLRRKYEGKEEKQEDSSSAIGEDFIVGETAAESPPVPEEPEGMEKKPVIKKDGKESEPKKKGMRKGMIFQRIRHIRHRAALEKMTEQRKMEELFILMRRQSYTSEMIRAVRKVIEYGITFEFLYAFVESEATAAELDALVAFKAPAPVAETGIVFEDASAEEAGMNGLSE